jgi:hypothetical protein
VPASPVAVVATRNARKLPPGKMRRKPRRHRRKSLSRTSNNAARISNPITKLVVKINPFMIMFRVPLGLPQSE